VAVITVERLSLHPEAVPALAEWFRSEWPDWYGPTGKGDVEADLRAFADPGSLPVGVVAFRDGVLCGAAALKAHSIPSHAHLAPWAAAGFVVPRLRNQGVGAALLSALEDEARALGYSHIYCGTGSAASLLRRSGWNFIDSVELEGNAVDVYEKSLHNLPHASGLLCG